MTVECFCDEWKTGMEQIVGAQVFLSTRAGYTPYTGATFRYCPWCGEAVHNIVEKDKTFKEIEEELKVIDKEVDTLQRESIKLLKHVKNVKEK